jgi:flagellar biosynthesis chaperone FliJ
MKKFAWRLQKVLEINQKRQQAKKAELFRLTEKLTLARANMFTQKRILQSLINDVTKKAPTERICHQQLLLKSTKKNDELIKKYSDEVHQLELDQQKLTAEYLKIRRFTEALEKLRERDKQKFIAEQEKIEQKEIDEHTSMRFAKQLIKHS